MNIYYNQLPILTKSPLTNRVRDELQAIELYNRDIQKEEGFVDLPIKLLDEPYEVAARRFGTQAHRDRVERDNLIENTRRRQVNQQHEERKDLASNLRNKLVRNIALDRYVESLRNKKFTQEQQKRKNIAKNPKIEDLILSSFLDLDGQGIWDSILNIGKKFLGFLPAASKHLNTASQVVDSAGKFIEVGKNAYNSVKENPLSIIKHGPQIISAGKDVVNTAKKFRKPRIKKELLAQVPITKDVKISEDVFHDAPNKMIEFD